MTRDHKLALIVGFSLILVVAVLITDHLSPGTNDRFAPLGVDPDTSAQLDSQLPGNPSWQEIAQNQQTNSDILRNQTVADNTNRRTNNDWIIPTGERRILQLRDPREAMQIEELPPDHHTNTNQTAEDQTSNNRYPEQLHRIASGDTLWSIAKKYYGDPSLAAELEKFNANRITSEGDLEIGTILRVPDREVLLGRVADPGSTNDHSPSNASNTEQPRTNPTYREYTIKSNDTLSEISQRELGTSRRWQEILELNSDTLSEATDIRVGQVIRLPND